jgi:hypothetical protein
MPYDEIEDAFSRANEVDDVKAAKDLFDSHPELLARSGLAADYMHTAARHGSTGIVALLASLGVDVNIPEDPRLPDRPIGSASALSRVETVRWLLDHGAEINYEWGGWPPSCKPLASATINGNFEIVKMLVEAGGYLNVLDRTNRTPLTWAIEYGRTDIANYLRSKGALEAHQIPGYKPPEPKSPLVQYIEKRFGMVQRFAWLPIIPDSVPVAVRGVLQEEMTFLFTDGMSSRTMKTPAGKERYAHAELVVLVRGWPETAKAVQSADYVWVINWMRQLAQYPFENDTWLGAPVTIIANGEPPAPLGAGTGMTCWLLCADKAPFERATLSDGKDVVFYSMLPIYTAERDYEREHGTIALLTRFAERNVPEYWEPKRPCVV